MDAVELEKSIIEKFKLNPEKDAWNVFVYLSNNYDIIHRMDDDSLMMGIIMSNIEYIKEKIKKEQDFQKKAQEFQNSQTDYNAAQLNAYYGSISGNN